MAHRTWAAARRTGGHGARGRGLLTMGLAHTLRPRSLRARGWRGLGIDDRNATCRHKFEILRARISIITVARKQARRWPGTHIAREVANQTLAGHRAQRVQGVNQFHRERRCWRSHSGQAAEELVRVILPADAPARAASEAAVAAERASQAVVRLAQARESCAKCLLRGRTSATSSKSLVCFSWAYPACCNQRGSYTTNAMPHATAHGQNSPNASAHSKLRPRARSEHGCQDQRS